MRLRTCVAISFAALAGASCGGGPPPADSPNGGCTGAWAGTQCVHEVVVGEVAASATAPPLATAPPPASAPPPPTSPPPVNDSPLSRARDPRTSRARPRAVALLVTELQQLEMLASATPDGQPDKAALLRRLAEDYVELETAALSAGRAPIALSSRKAAIRHYEALIAGFPSYPPLDDVRYFDALEHERGGDLSDARRLYYDVITHHPTSRWVAYSYFAFGEMFAGEGASDPSKLDLALQAYQKVVAYPPPVNAIYGWGWLRIGNVEEQKGDAAHARDAYAKARDFATSYAQLPGSGDLLAAIPP